MSGTAEGSRKAVAKILKKNPNHFRDMGRIGGRNGTGHEFGHGKVDPSVAGTIGGSVRGYKHKKTKEI